MTRSHPIRAISAVLAEVKSARRQAERVASDTTRGGHYFSRLSAVVDCRIRTESGEGQLIWIACAAELGVLKSSHLELNCAAREALREKALNALFWAVVRRWSQTRTNGLNPRRKSIPTQIRSVPPCQDCHALDRDRRRYTPHRWLEQENPASAASNELGAPMWFRCVLCETQWVRRLVGSEYFVCWSICSARALC
jgi:hypothetical protein